MSEELKHLDWSDIDTQCDNILRDCDQLPLNCVVGLSRGGLVPATIIANHMNVRKVYVHGYHSYDEQTKTRNRHGVMYQDVVYDLMKSQAGHNILIVDDLCDRGITMQGLVKRLYKKFHEDAVNIYTAGWQIEYSEEFVSKRQPTNLLGEKPTKLHIRLQREKFYLFPMKL